MREDRIFFNRNTSNLLPRLTTLTCMIITGREASGWSPDFRGTDKTLAWALRTLPKPLKIDFFLNHFMWTDQN